MPTKSMMELVTEIVAGQSSQRTLSGEEIANLIRQTYRALKEIEMGESSGKSSEGLENQSGTQTSANDVYDYEIHPATSEPKIDPQESIQDDQIVCIECGASYKTLTHTHLGHHGLTSDQYKEKWGIPAKQPLAARSVSDRRRARAKESNVGEALKVARAKARSEKALRAVAQAELQSDESRNLKISPTLLKRDQKSSKEHPTE